ncbi:MAG: CHAT domain-containing protein [Candidatus Rokubacteria bacterium]|nr:CHAT domain-containing protein [Candidatus Rokubacteria bacterium]
MPDAARGGTLDFDVRISRAGGDYEAVADSPVGEGRVTFARPFTPEMLDEFWRKIGRPRDVRRRVEEPDLVVVKEAGHTLFQAAFAGTVGDCLTRSIDRAARDGATLRIRLRLGDAPELADLPWEYLYDKQHDRLLGLHVDTPLVRYLDLPTAIPTLTVAPPLGILVVASSPRDAAALNVAREIENVRESLARVTPAIATIDYLGPNSPHRATLDNLIARLRQPGRYHVIHFIGHGGFDASVEGGFLLLENEHEYKEDVAGHELALLFQAHRSIRVVVLNACEGARSSPADPFSGVAQTLVKDGIPAVVAMQAEITDEAAIIFAGEFYSTLADGQTIEAAVVRARVALYLNRRHVEWGTPVLYSRAPDGRVFDIEARPPRVNAESIVAAPTAPVVSTTPSRPAGWGDRLRRLAARGVAISAVAAAVLLTVGAGLGWYLWDRRALVVEAFDAKPSEVVLGQPMELTWHVPRATEVRFIGSLEPVLPDVQPSHGTRSIQLTEVGEHVITLAASRHGRPVYDEVRVRVKPIVVPALRVIRIQAAVWGSDSGTCTVTKHVAERCDGNADCAVVANNELGCGDPDPARRKKLTVVWSCLAGDKPVGSQRERFAEQNRPLGISCLED